MFRLNMYCHEDVTCVNVDAAVSNASACKGSEIVTQRQALYIKSRLVSRGETVGVATEYSSGPGKFN